MKKISNNVQRILAEFEDRVATQEAAKQSRQTFSGSIRVQSEKVFVKRSEGIAALLSLQKLGTKPAR